MANPTSHAPTAATPQQELAALVSQVAALSILAVNITQHCVDTEGEALSLRTFITLTTFQTKQCPSLPWT
jgi:hypothetical protein